MAAAKWWLADMAVLSAAATNPRTDFAPLAPVWKTRALVEHFEGVIGLYPRQQLRLADPRVRLAAGTVVMLTTALAAHRDRVSRYEAAAFRAVNDLPGSLYPPAWVIMQLGTIGAAPASAGVAWLAGDRELAGRLLAGGTATWALSKLVKRIVRRPRPAILLSGTRHRGPDAAGLGYLSGHAGVAVALGAAALPRLGPAARALTLAAIPTVGLTRVYVGAHLPLDIAGGAALGLAVDAALALAQDVLTPPAAGPGPAPGSRRANRRERGVTHRA